MTQSLINRISRILFATCMSAAPIAAIADVADLLVSQVERRPSVDTAAEPSIVGRWVTSLNTTPPNYSLATFFPGGQTLADDSGTQLRIAQQGEWIKIGPRQYIRSMMTFNFDAPRTFTGLNKVTNFIQLNEAGDEYDGEGFSENYDVNGNLTTTRVIASHARRCTLAMTLPQCIGVAPLTKSSD